MNRRRNGYTIASLFVVTCLFGCETPIPSAKFCSVRAYGAGDVNSLLLAEEPAGYLVAKLLRCGEREFYLGGSPTSDSSSILAAFTKTHASTIPARWDLTIGCPEAMEAYPIGGQKTSDFLSKLCSEISAPKDVP